MADARQEKPALEKLEKLEAQVKSVDMTDEMQSEAIEIATEAVTKYTVERVGLLFELIFNEQVKIDSSILQDIAQHIKKEFDNRKGATWHCIVGRNFGSFVTHETKHFIYFYLGHVAILLFKTQ